MRSQIPYDNLKMKPTGYSENLKKKKSLLFKKCSWCMFIPWDLESITPVWLALHPNNSLQRCLKQIGFGFRAPSNPKWTTL